MWSYLSPIDLSGSVFSQSIFHWRSCILPFQSEAVHFYRFHIGLYFVYYAFPPNITWADCLVDRFHNFLSCSCFPSHTLWFWNSQGTKNLTAIIVRAESFCGFLKRDKYFRAIKRLGMCYRVSKVGTLPFINSIHAFSSSYSSVSAVIILVTLLRTFLS